jgi:hypothetical protein
LKREASQRTIEREAQVEMVERAVMQGLDVGAGEGEEEVGEGGMVGGSCRLLCFSLFTFWVSGGWRSFGLSFV